MATHSMPVSGVVVVCALVLPVFAACGAGPIEGPNAAASASAGSPPPADNALASSSASASAPASAVLPPPLPPPPAPAEWKVALVSPGDEPRKPLRYVFHVGAKEVAVMDMRMILSLEFDGAKKDMPTAPVTMTVTIVPQTVLPSGNLDYKFTLDAIDLAKDSDPSFAPYRTPLQQLVGTAGEMEVTPQGKTEKTSVTPPPGASDQIAEVTDQLVGALRDMMLPLPDEPIGKGAKWTASGPFPVKPVVATRTTTCTLTKIAGTKGAVDAIEAVTGPPQTITTPGGQRADLQSMKGAGTRTSSFDLGKLVPTSTWSLTADSVQVLVQPDGSHQIQAHSQIVLNLVPKK
jgi:hypothetical protein